MSIKLNIKTAQERWTNVIRIVNAYNEEGNPTGGTVSGIGINITWQEGPIAFDYERGRSLSDPNGAFVEDIILSAIERLTFFQEAAAGKFKCRENAVAITKLEEALMWLQRRHDDRVNRKVQGQHKS